MPITAERLEVEVHADTSAAKRELDSFSNRTKATAAETEKAGKSATGMGSKFKTAGMLVKAAAGTMVVSLAGKAVMAASDLNEQVSKVGVVFGPQAKIVTNAAQNMADKFGMSKTVFLEAAGNIGLIGKASGLSEKGAAKLSTRFAKMAADASSFYNVPVDEALESIRSGLVGEAEPMRKFGVLLSEAAVQTKALSMGIVKPIKNTAALKVAQMDAAKAQKDYTKAVVDHGKQSPEATRALVALQQAQDNVAKAAKGTVPPLTEAQKVQARAALITKGMADAHGDLARTQSSVANRLREIKGRLTNFAADMGQKALPAVSKFLGGLLKLPGALKKGWDWGKKFIDGFLTPFKPLLDPLAGLLKKAATNTDDFGRALKPIGGFIQAHGKAFGVAAGVITALFIPAMVSAATTATVTKVKVVASFIAQQAASAKTALMVGVNFAKMAAFYVQYAAVTVAQAARVAAAMVASAVKSAAALAANAARVVASWVLMGAQSLIQAARMAAAWVIAMGPVGWVIATVAALAAVIIKNWDKIKNATTAIWGGIAGGVKAAWGKIKGAAVAGAKATLGFVKAHWRVIISILLGPLGVVIALTSKYWGQIKGLFMQGINTIRGVWTAGWAAVKAKASEAWHNISTTVSNGVTRVVNWVKGIPGKIKGVFSSAGTILMDAGRQIIDGFISGISSKFGAVKDKLGSLTHALTSWKGPPTKDRKLLIKNGRLVIQGFIKGLQGEFPAVKKYLAKVTNWVRDSFSGDTERRLVARIRGVQKRVREAIQREDKITQRLKDAMAKRDALRDQKSSFIDSMRSGISDQANVLNAGNNAGTIKDSLVAQVGKAKEFAANLVKMKKMGYPRDLIAQVAGAGIEGGAEVAKALVAASAADAGGITQAFQQINDIAKNQSEKLGGLLYDPGIQAANGLIAGLKSKKSEIEQVLLVIAKGMQAAIKKALGIKSPSRVMIGLMKWVGLGAIKGLDLMRKPVNKAAAKMGLQVTNGVSGALGPSLPGPGRPGAGSGGLTPASMGGGRTGGDVHFHFDTRNPVAEPQSRTTNKALDRVASLGLV